MCSESRSDSDSLGEVGELVGCLVALLLEEFVDGLVGEHVGAEVLGGEGLGGEQLVNCFVWLSALNVRPCGVEM